MTVAAAAIAVADTTPLNYLVLIGAIEVLPALFGEVITPPAVLAELQHERTPAVVKVWAVRPPEWLRVVSPRVRLPATAKLDPGEAAAIEVAKESGASAILMDEQKGRKVAQREGLTVLRTLGLLELAARRGLVDLPTAIDALRRTPFRITEDYLIDALKRDAERRRAGP